MKNAIPWDVGIVGTGPAGLAAALALAGLGLRVIAVGMSPGRPDTRTAALFTGSVQLLANLGAWDDCRAAGEPIRAETDLYLADTMGELGLFYRLSGIAVLGKSLIGRGGQNPLEAARLGCAVLYGPHMDNFPEITATLEAAGAARPVPDEAALAAAVDALLTDEPARSAMGQAGQALADGEAAVVDRILDRLVPLLPAGRIG